MINGTLFAPITFPETWPPESESPFYQQQLPEGIVAVTGDQNHVIRVQINLTDETVLSYQFQKVIIPPNATVVLAVRIQESVPSLWINTTAVSQDPDTQLPPIEIPTNKGHKNRDRSRIYQDLEKVRCSDRTETYFLNTVSDLDHKASQGSNYELIRASAAIRSLLLEGFLDKVNRKYRLKLLFSIIDHRTPPPLKPEKHWKTIDPTNFPDAETIQLSLEGFLSTTIYESGDSTATIRDVIRLCANVKGGVHHGISKKTQTGEILLDEFDDSFRWQSIEPSVAILRGIIRVSIIAFGPLIDAILTSNKST